MSLPIHFQGFEVQGLNAAAIENQSPVVQFEIGDYRNFIYLILDWASRTAVIVDPQSDLSQPLAALKSQGFELRACLLTHSHFDHIAGLAPLAKSHPGLPVFVHESDAHRLEGLDPSRICFVVDGEVLRLNGSPLLAQLPIRVLHTPGHSAGEASYLVSLKGSSYLLTGDTLFIRDCGRTDLPTGSNQQMFESLQKIRALPSGTVILPGHHYVREIASLLETELRESPPFQCNSVEELGALP